MLLTKRQFCEADVLGFLSWDWESFRKNTFVLCCRQEKLLGWHYYGGSEEGWIESLRILENGDQWCKTPAAEFKFKKNNLKQESLCKLSLLH